MEQTNKVVVTLNKGVDVDAFIDEMSQPGNISPYVPARSVDIFNLKPQSLYNVDFTMTHAEMEELKKDPRVRACRWGTAAENGINFGLDAISSSQYYYRAPVYTAPGNADINWGLYDSSSTINPFTQSGLLRSRPYALDGTGVDIVIQDTGLQVDHPEFQDANGVSRVQQINWWTAAGQSGPPPWIPDPTQNNMPLGFYTDTNGHGTNVGSIAAGKTYGWATNAAIYVMNFESNLYPSPDPFDSFMLQFDLIRLWHLRKRAAGNNRPTIVNMSWGTRFTLTSFLSEGNYRGNRWEGKFPQPSRGLISAYSYPGFNINNIYVEDLASTVEDCLDAGVILVGTAGNNSYKIDVPGGIDYNNYASIPNVYNWYYHRGATPGAVPGVICVGAIDYTYNSTGTPYVDPLNPSQVFINRPNYKVDQANTKASFSACGPRVDVYAPGGMIAGATCNDATIAPRPTLDNQYPVTYYYKNTPTDQFKQQKASGTSQAAPQVTGVLACVLGMRPWMTPADCKSWIQENSIMGKTANTSNAASMGITSVNNGYTDPFNLQNGSSTAPYLYFPYQGLDQFGNVFDMTGGTNTQTGAQNQGGIAGSFGT